MNGISAHGLVSIHSAPRALLSHLEWTITRACGQAVQLDWLPQRLIPGHFRAEAVWQAPFELGAAIASDLRGWADLRFEVTQQASDQTEGYIWAYTPSLGMFSAQTDRFGNVLITEHEIRLMLQAAGANPYILQRNLRNALGEDWDAELDPLRGSVWDEPQRLRSIG